VAERNSAAQTAEDLELVINRVFDAPRELLWKAWTDPEMMKVWSAPRGFTIPRSEGELKVNGTWHATMVKPDGEELNLGGRYLEIVEPERLVFTHVWMDENGNPTSPDSTCTVTLTARGNKTEMNFRQTGFDSEGARDGHNEGWNECFDKLDEMLSAA